jgi:hypothetical protein
MAKPRVEESIAGRGADGRGDAERSASRDQNSQDRIATRLIGGSS